MSFIKNKKGQAVLEYVLLSAIGVTLFLFIRAYFSKNESLEKFFSFGKSSVNKRLSSMIEYGTWRVEDQIKHHPNNILFHYTEKPRQ